MFTQTVPQVRESAFGQVINSSIQCISIAFDSITDRTFANTWYVNDEDDLSTARLRRNEFDPAFLPTYTPEKNEYDELSLEELLEL